MPFPLKHETGLGRRRAGLVRQASLGWMVWLARQQPHTHICPKRHTSATAHSSMETTFRTPGRRRKNSKPYFGPGTPVAGHFSVTNGSALKHLERLGMSSHLKQQHCAGWVDSGFPTQNMQGFSLFKLGRIPPVSSLPFPYF